MIKQNVKQTPIIRGNDLIYSIAGRDIQSEMHNRSGIDYRSGDARSVIHHSMLDEDILF